MIAADRVPVGYLRDKAAAEVYRAGSNLDLTDAVPGKRTWRASLDEHSSGSPTG